MSEKQTNKKKVLDLLMDKRPHYSAEFRDQLGLLEYRKRIMELREEGWMIESIKIGKRPAYQLIGHSDEQVRENEGQKEWEFPK